MTLGLSIAMYLVQIQLKETAKKGISNFNEFVLVWIKPF
jgi:hypothetical protein